MYAKIKDVNAVRELIRAEAKIEAIAKEMYGIDLRASGQDDLKACCPFHKEDTPSFGIRTSKQLYYCFGCKAGGDVFKFVQEMDNVDHMQAIVKIAEFIGFDLKPYKEAYTPEERRQQEFYNLNRDVADFALTEDTANYVRVKEFAKARRFPMDVMREFEIGFTSALEPENVPNAEMDAAMALQFTMRGKWENRLCIPLKDHYGRIAGFRNKDIDGSSKIKIIGPEQGHPLPVPEIYGLYEARKYIRAAGYVIMVEGEPDVWQMHAAGYKNTVGCMGSKLNASMLATLESLSITKIVLLPDNDEAGRKFARSVAEANNGKFLIKIGTLRGNGKDPDEVLLSDGHDAIGAALGDAKYTFDYLVDRVVEPYDVSRHTDRLDILHDLKVYVAQCSPVVRELCVRRLADTLGLDYEVILDFYREQTEKDETAPLHNILAERVVLKRMLTDEEFIGDALLALKPADFYLSKHRGVFECISKLYRKQETVNEDTVRTVLENKTGEGARSLVSSIVASGVDVSSSVFMLGDLRDKAIRREVQQKARDAANKLGVSKLDAREVVQALSADISKALVSGGSRIADVGTIVNERMSLMHQQLKAPNAIIGLDLGPDFPILNNTLHGLQKKRYMVLAAPSGVGKTAFAGVVAKRVALDLKEPTLFFSFETGKEAITDRLISNLAGIESDKILTGFLEPNEVGLVHHAAERLAAAPIVITERGVVYEDCVSIIRNDVIKRGTRLVIVDYMQLMSMAGADARLRRDQEIGLISRGFLELSSELDLTMLVLAQMNRDAVKAGSNEGTGIGESFKIFQDADVFITFREKTKEEIEADGLEKGNRRGKLAKNRHGRGNVDFNMIADLDVMRVSEYVPNRRPTR